MKMFIQLFLGLLIVGISHSYRIAEDTQNQYAIDLMVSANTDLSKMVASKRYVLGLRVDNKTDNEIDLRRQVAITDEDPEKRSLTVEKNELEPADEYTKKLAESFSLIIYIDTLNKADGLQNVFDLGSPFLRSNNAMVTVPAKFMEILPRNINIQTPGEYRIAAYLLKKGKVVCKTKTMILNVKNN